MDTPHSKLWAEIQELAGRIDSPCITNTQRRRSGESSDCIIALNSNHVPDKDTTYTHLKPRSMEQKTKLIIDIEAAPQTIQVLLCGCTAERAQVMQELLNIAQTHNVQIMCCDSPAIVDTPDVTGSLTSRLPLYTDYIDLRIPERKENKKEYKAFISSRINNRKKK